VGQVLDGLAPHHLLALHDRRLRDLNGRLTRANIDHLVIAASGVWVVDAKTHRGGLEVRRSGGFLSPPREQLRIGGRDRTDLVSALAKQVAVVRAELTAGGVGVRVRGALCFVGTDLPLFGESIGDVPLVSRCGLATLLKRPGDLGRGEREAVAHLLAVRLPPR
jgi:hypothetical protein